MAKFGEDVVMDLGVVESFAGIQIIPRGMEESYDVKPYVFGASAGSSGGAEPGLGEGSENAEPVDTPEQVAYKEGYAAAKAEFAAAQAQLASRVEETLAYLNKALDSAERNLDQQTLRLAIMVAEKLACRALQQDPEAVIARAFEALSHEQNDLPLSVVADPATASVLRNQLAQLRSSLQISAIEIEEDSRLAPGDMRLSRGAITLDARMATRLVRIRGALERELGLEIQESDS